MELKKELLDYVVSSEEKVKNILKIIELHIDNLKKQINFYIDKLDGNISQEDRAYYSREYLHAYYTLQELKSIIEEINSLESKGK